MTENLGHGSRGKNTHPLGCDCKWSESWEELALRAFEVEAMTTGLERGCHLPIGVLMKANSGSLEPSLNHIPVKSR